jgi:hypothetical protein
MRIGHRKLLGLHITCTLLLAAVVLVLSVLPTPTAPAAAWHTSAASGPLADTPVRNFGVVEQGILYRSAQPHPLALPWLRRYGIASIVNLREQQYDDGAGLLAGLGYTSYLHLPIDDHAAPTDAQAAEFLAFVQDQRHWPVLVHCAEGKGRTGVLVALARYAIDGWTIDQALAEANTYTNKLALSDTQRAWLAQWAQAHAPGDQRATSQPAIKQES